MSNVIPFNRDHRLPEDDMSVARLLPVTAAALTIDRRLYRHAFESAVVLDLAPGMSSFELYMFKTGQMLRTKVRITPTPMRHKTEAVAAYIAATGVHVRPTVLKRGRYIAAIDGLSDDGKRVVEIVLDDGEDYVIRDLRDNVEARWLPAHVAIRLQHLMAVADAEFADLWIFDQRSGTGQRMSIRRNVGLMARIFTAWDVFQECIDKKQALLWMPAT